MTMQSIFATLSLSAFLFSGPALGASNGISMEEAGALQTWNPETRPVVRIQAWKAGIGDDLSWSRPEFDDHAWDMLRVLPEELFPNEGNTTRFTCFRTTVRLDARPDTLNPLFIRILFLPGSHDYFWDGI